MLTVITVSRTSAEEVNNSIIKHLFHDKDAVGYVRMDTVNPILSPVYKGMRVMITHNLQKEYGLVNGVQGVIECRRNNTIIVKLENGGRAALFPLSYKHQSGYRTVHPFFPSYALTICKCQGQNLQHIVMWLDTPSPPPGAAYVGLSRVRTLEDVHFLVMPKPSQFPPVSWEDL